MKTYEIQNLNGPLIYHVINLHNEGKTNPEEYDCLSHGIGDGKVFHSDIEYFYFIAPGILRVYEPYGEWKLIEEHVI